MLHTACFISKKQYEQAGLYDSQYVLSGDIDLMLRVIKLYPMNFLEIPIIPMEQGGSAQKDKKRTAREFAEVTVGHGMPRWLAGLIYAIKMYFIWPCIHVIDFLSGKPHT